MTFALRSVAFPSPCVFTRTPQRRRSSLRSGGPVRVSASVFWSLHKKGTRCDDVAVVDLSASLHSKHFVTVSDAGGAADDVTLTGLLGVGRVELAFEEVEVSMTKNEEIGAKAAAATREEKDAKEVGRTKGSEQLRPRAALFVTDIGSEAVVLVDGEPLAKKQRRRLRPGSVLSFHGLKGEGGEEGEKCEFELFRNEVAHA